MFEETKFNVISTNWWTDEELQAEVIFLKLQKEWPRDF